MDVFKTFPNAVVYDRFELGSYQRGTVVGNQFTSAGGIDVLIDEGDDVSISTAPNVEPLEADLLLYVKPSQLPTTNPRELVAGYMVYDSEEDDYFAIIKADIGRNQEIGEIEHIELFLRQTGVAS